MAIPRAARLLLVAASLPAGARAEAGGGAGGGPGVSLSHDVRPRLLLRRRVPEVDGLEVGVNVSPTEERRADMVELEASYQEPFLDGKVVLRSDRTLEWRKAYLLPGLLDAATRLTLRSSLDLKNGSPFAEVKLGLRRRQASRGVRLVHRLPLDGEFGRCGLDIGATLTLPDDLRLATEEGGGPQQLLDEAQLGVAFDTLDLHVDL